MNKSQILKEIKSHYGFVKDTDFAHFLGISPQVLSNWYTRNTFDYDILYTKCVDVNIDWIFTGVGEMLKSKGNEILKYDDKLLSIPIVDISVAAGDGAINSDYIEVEETIQIPDRLVHGYEKYLCVRVRGDSMAPTLQDSSFLVIGLIHPSQWYKMPDKHVYVVVDREGQSFVKRLKNRVKRGFIVCMSDNVDKARYPNFNIDVENLHGIWHAEWYLSAKMENINENYYYKLEQLEDRVDGIETLLGNQTLSKYLSK